MTAARAKRDLIEVLSTSPMPGKGAVLPPAAYAGAMPNPQPEQISMIL
jgi:hypothetical protein